ncbi:UDP-glycosyltransferase 83A1-like [Pistacia vera]|uniref:UDP-glycosyltransferase 83A1-like n=1 Tax=Pistacia vera TaxID=55513 RepID=UPI00126345A7|nr:UDP-glycosyltransferase 83A1-like [Pistacia vera]
MGKRPHVLAIAYPAQGHIGALMKLCHLLADHDIKVTFVNTESINARVLAAMSEKGKEDCKVDMVVIPDGIDRQDERKDRIQLSETMVNVMPGHLEDLIMKINLSCDKKISCVIADATNAWALDVAGKMGIKRAMFWPSLVGGFALSLHIQELIQAKIIDHNGTPLTNEKIQISPELLAMIPSEFIWSCPDSSICDLIPNLLPIGPLLSINHPGKPTGNFWPEDSTCLHWLDKQPAQSVIYVAFGSIAIFNQCQFEELALGLELSGQPFLWVVRSDLMDGSIIKYPEGFLDRVASRGKITEWAPQEKVLAHSSIACFVSHCGWNSTMEGLSMGVPFLCWRYFADQFLVKSYICEVWKAGLGLNIETNGIISSHEIRRKLDKLLCDGGIRDNVTQLKEMARKSGSEGGSSMNNFEIFIKQLRC